MTMAPNSRRIGKRSSGGEFEHIGRSVQRQVGVGISVGLASLHVDETLEELTARADATLLDLKKRHDA